MIQVSTSSTVLGPALLQSASRHVNRFLSTFAPATTTTTTTTTTTPFYGSLYLVRDNPGDPVPARSIHPLTPIVVINHSLSAPSIYYDPWHPPCSIYVPNSLFAQSIKVFFGLPLALTPYTSYSIHFFIQSLSSFCSTCPYPFAPSMNNIITFSMLNPSVSNTFVTS